MYMYCIRFLCSFFCISRYFLLSLYVENNIITTVIIIYHNNDNTNSYVAFKKKVRTNSLN